MNYATILPQEGVSPKKKDVTLRGTFFPKTNSKSPLGKGRLEGQKTMLNCSGYNGSNNEPVNQAREVNKTSVQNHGKPGNFGKVKPPQV